MQIVYMLIFSLGGVICGWLIRWVYAKNRLTSTEQQVNKMKDEAVINAEKAKKEILLEAQNKVLEERRGYEREVREQRSEIQRNEKRIQQKEDNLDRKISDFDRKQSALQKRERDIEHRESELAEGEKKWLSQLEKISGITVEDAKKILTQSIENDARHDAQGIINKIEQEANAYAEKKARSILVATIQRLATEITTEFSVASVSLPSEEMKGRIIGREGRNIRTLETLTGVDIIIDDTPEAVVISCFDPIRKTIAKTALESLIQDGRIHPSRIEEMVHKVANEINQKIQEEGEKVLYDLGIHGMKPEAIKALGRLHYRTSYGQNVLAHSKECAIIAGMIASEVGAEPSMAKRAALLHDIGKGLESDSETGHAEVGADLVRRLGEDKRVVNAVRAHHDDEEIISIEGVIVQIADAISAARPGARRESLDNYIKRLENLEKIAKNFNGVDSVFAIQAGRELRIMVNNELVDDQNAKVLARDVAREIEKQLSYPGRIRVTIIRETRVVEYAR